LGWNEAEEAFGKVQVILTFLIQVAFMVAFVIAFFEGQWMVMFVSIVGMVAIWLPLFFAKNQRVHIPIEFEFLLAVFIYASIFLGEIQGFYTRFWWWDVVLHTGSGIALGFIGFLILYSLFRNKRLGIPPGLLAVFSFAFALALGALWEIFEFVADNIFGFNMQKHGLTDTMWDLIIDAIGAFVAAVSGYFYVKYEKRGVGIFEYYLTAYFRSNG
jgi:hypothetical protein